MTALYARALGARFDALPDALRRFHGGPGLWRGSARLTQGGALARRMVRAMGYPDRDGDVPLTLRIAADGDAEVWRRDFDGPVVETRQSLVRPGVIAERLGPMTVELRCEAAPPGLRLAIAAARLGPLPGPRPAGGGLERAEGRAVRFDVTARAPGLGLLIRYEGLLEPA